MEVKPRILPLVCVALLSGCSVMAEPAAPAKQGSAELARVMEGVFQTPKDSENNFVDTRLTMAAMGEGEWLYQQINTGEERKVYRQRVLQLIDGPDGGVVQQTWKLKDDAGKHDLLIDREMLVGLTVEDIEAALPAGCDQLWRVQQDGSWYGHVDPAVCQIFSERRQATIGIESEVELSAEQMLTTERGYDSDGKQLFGTDPGEFIVLERQSQ